MVTQSFLGAIVQEVDDYPMAHHRPVTLVIPSLGNIAWGNRIMPAKVIDLEKEPQEAQVWDEYHVKQTTWKEWTIMAEDFLLETYGDGKPGKARRGLTVEIVKATLSSPQNLEGCAISTSVRKLHNRIRRIQRLRTLEHRQHRSNARSREA